MTRRLVLFVVLFAVLALWMILMPGQSQSILLPSRDVGIQVGPQTERLISELDTSARNATYILKDEEESNVSPALTWSISGRVMDQEGHPVPGVGLGVEGPSPGLIWAVTDDNGYYALTDLIAGTYAFVTFTTSLIPWDRVVTVPPSATGQDFTVHATTCSRPIILVPGMMASANWKCFLFEEGCDIRGAWGWTHIPKLNNAESYYRPLIEDLEAAGCTRDSHYLSVVLYDWRQPIADNVAWLKDAIDSAKLHSGEPEVDIIGHSMGGLLGRAYVQDDGYGYDVSHLITLGSPHLGAAKAYPMWEALFLYRMLPTEKVIYSIILHHLIPPFNKPLLEFLRSWVPSALEVMPGADYYDSGQAQAGYLYDEQQGDRLILESQMWQRNSYLSSLNDGLETLFARTSVSTFFGVGLETPERFFVHERSFWDWPCWDDGEPNWSREIPGFMGDGDGTVPAKSAVLPSPANQVSFSGIDHGGLPGDQSVIEEIFDLLGLPAPSGRERTALTEDANAGLVVIAVDGPVDATVIDPLGNSVGPGGTTIPEAEYVSDPEDPYKLVLLPTSEEGLFEIILEGHRPGTYEIALLDAFSPVPEVISDVMTLWDSSVSQIEEDAVVSFALTFTLETSPTTSIIAVTPVVEIPIWAGDTTVVGRARPRHALEIRDADTDALLGSGAAGEDGHFSITLTAPLVLHQRIYPWSEGVAGVPVAVRVHGTYLPVVIR